MVNEVRKLYLRKENPDPQTHIQIIYDEKFPSTLWIKFGDMTTSFCQDDAEKIKSFVTSAVTKIKTENIRIEHAKAREQRLLEKKELQND